METTNKTKKILIVLACLLVAVLIGYVIFQNQQIRKLSKDVNSDMTSGSDSAGKDVSGQTDAAQNNTARTGPVADASNEGDDLKYQLEAAEEELDAANKQLSDDAAQKAENAKGMIEMQRKMLQDPAYQKTLRSTYKGMLDTLYGSLYKDLKLATEKQDEFKELLLDQMMSSMEISLDMLGAEPSEEKRSELQKRMDDLKKQGDDKITSLLGGRDFKTYEAYRETLSERQVVEMFGESLGEDDKLTDSEKETLIEDIYKERKNIYSQQGWAEERVTFSSELNDEGVAKMMDMNDRTYDGYIKASGATLTASQQEQFKAYLKKQRDMTESALKMSAQMYGGQTTQNGTDKKAE